MVVETITRQVIQNPLSPFWADLQAVAEITIPLEM